MDPAFSSFHLGQPPFPPFKKRWDMGQCLSHHQSCQNMLHPQSLLHQWCILFLSRTPGARLPKFLAAHPGPASGPPREGVEMSCAVQMDHVRPGTRPLIRNRVQVGAAPAQSACIIVARCHLRMFLLNPTVFGVWSASDHCVLPRCLLLQIRSRPPGGMLPSRHTWTRWPDWFVGRVRNNFGT